MKPFYLIFFCFLLTSILQAQKKPLDHSVYDSWQSLGEKIISADGKWFAFVVNLQEGDGELVIRSADGMNEKHISRGYNQSFSENGRFLVARIKPYFKDLRQAKIKKLPEPDLPKDSLLILDLSTDSLRKIPEVKSYKLTELGEAWLAIHFWNKTSSKNPEIPDSLAKINRLLTQADSLIKMADSLRQRAATAKLKGWQSLVPTASVKNTSPAATGIIEGTSLQLINLANGTTMKFELVNEYLFSKNGHVFVIETSGKKEPLAQAAVILWQDLISLKTDTVQKGFNDARNFALAEDGGRLAFSAERDSSAKALKKLFKIWMYHPGMDSAIIWAKPGTSASGSGYIVQPEFKNYFSKDGSRLFIGLSSIPQIKDTSLVDFETARLDLWNYRDDYLQPQQLVQLNAALKQSWLALIDTGSRQMIQLGDDSCESVVMPEGGNSRYALGLSTKGSRIQQQWTQHNISSLFLIDTKDGSRKLIARQLYCGRPGISPSGKFIYWYDLKSRKWMSYSIVTASIQSISKDIPHPLFDEEDDHPDDPPAYGLMGWFEQDQRVFLYDRYDIWSCDPTAQSVAVNLTDGLGRRNKAAFRYQKTDPEETWLSKQQILLHVVEEKSRKEAWLPIILESPLKPLTMSLPVLAPARFDQALKAKSADVLLYRKQDPSSSNLYLTAFPDAGDFRHERVVSRLNPQQANYNWYTVELKQWKMFDGKMSTGLLYKPENFDSTKKYPVILYFYERDVEDRYNYIEPMPVRASINIAYYTSNGYLVFDPDIYYHTGKPGEDAYNSVVSAAAFLSKFSWVDSSHMGIQGHSWGGYQVAYLVTRTNRFAAAEAGAPVSNMTSAYGGIRWGTGISRQFQYEKTQSRLGATLWEQPQLFIKNSPLFRADKIRTPLLLLHNDKDDAVPWYQGIELFTALKRLDKPVWLVSYNDELHGIIERKNRKDWTIRMAQFFDHYLKNKPAPKWMTEGIPAIKKGIDWGLDY